MPIIHLYEFVLDQLHITHGVSYFIKSTIGVKQGCPLFPKLFGIYMDELESFLHDLVMVVSSMIS
jgi:hypothetical protein